jgi:hypothetical protein
MSQGQQAEGVAMSNEFIVAQQLGVQMHSDPQNVLTPELASDAQKAGLTLSQLTFGNSSATAFTAVGSAAVTDAGGFAASSHPSTAPQLTYDQYNADWWIAGNCSSGSINPGMIDWSKVAGTFSYTTDPSTGDCKLNASVPMRAPVLGNPDGSAAIGGNLTPQGSISNVVTSVNDGNWQYSQTADDDASNRLNLWVNGQGDIASGANEIINMAAGSQMAVSGEGETVNASSSNILNATGSADTVNISGTGTSVSIGGNGHYADSAHDNHVTFGSGDSGTVTETDNSRLDVSAGSGATINAGNNDYLGVSGTADAVNLLGSGTSVWVGGNGHYADSAHDDHVYFGSGDSGTVYESDNSRVDVSASSGATVTAGNNDYLGVAGSADTVNMFGTGSTLWIGGNGHYADAAHNDSVTFGSGDTGTVYESDNSRIGVSAASGATVNTGNNDYLGVAGSADTVNMSGTGTSLWIGGNGQYADSAHDDHVYFGTGDSGTVYENDNSRVDVGTVIGASFNAGNNDYLGLSGGADSVSIAGTGTSIWIGGNGQYADYAHDDHVTVAAGGSGTVYENDNSRLDVTAGSGSTINAGNNDYLGVSGAGDAVNMLGTGTSLWIGGNGQYVDAAHNDSVTFGSGDSGTIYESDNSCVGVSAASGATISVGNNDYLGVSGSADVVTVAGTGTSLWIGGNGQTADAAHDDHVSFASGDIGTVYQNDNSRVDVTGNSDSVNLGNNCTSVISGTGDTVNIGGTNCSLTDSSGRINMTDSSAILTLAGTSDSVYVGGNWDNVTENGSGDTIYTASNDTLWATGDVVYAAGDLGAGQSAGQTVVHGNADTIDVNTTAGIGVWAYGNNDTLSVASGVNGTFTVDGTSDLVNLASSGDTVSVMAYSTGVTISGTGEIVQLGGDSTVSLTGSQDTVDVGSSGNAITGTDDRIDVTGAEGLSIGGNNDVMTGSHDTVGLSSSNETLTVNGSYDSFSASGSGDKVIDNVTSGGSVVDTWNNGVESSTDYTGGDGTGAVDGYSYSGGGSGGYYYYGGFDRVNAKNATSRSASIDRIGKFDRDFGESEASTLAASPYHATAQSTQGPAAPANGTAAGSTHEARYEGGAWNHKTITYAFGTSSDPKFSGAIEAQYQATIAQSFSDWAAASGLTFQQVSDPSKADIVLGWSDLNTQQSGVLGRTSLKSKGGVISSGVHIQLEDPSQAGGLALNSAGQYVYSGSGATLKQLSLHEIGRALGLGTNDDSNSVMNFYSTSSNLSLDGTDTSAILQLYSGASPTTATAPLTRGAQPSTPPGTPSGTASSDAIASLVQAMAVFGSPTASASTDHLAIGAASRYQPTLVNAREFHHAYAA